MESQSGISIGFVGTYPPTVCGIATYTASLVGALIQSTTLSPRIGVVSLSDGVTGPGIPPVIHRHRRGDQESLRLAARVLNGYDVVSIQHEFGIYGGDDGSEVVDLMSKLTVPVVVTLHTVLTKPTPNQEMIIERICDMAEEIIVM